jgi:hypothetical protein
MTRPCVRGAVAPALAVLLVAVGAAANANDERAFDPLPGTWVIQIDIPGEPNTPLRTYLQQFTRDGRSSVFLASGLPASGDGWTDTRSGCVGDWRGVGRHQYDLTLHCLWSDQDYAPRPHSGR